MMVEATHGLEQHQLKLSSLGVMPYFAAMMLYSETASTAKLFLYLGGDGVVGDDEDYNDVNDDMCVCI